MAIESLSGYSYLGLKALRCFWENKHLELMDQLHQKVKVGGLNVMEYEKIALIHKALDILEKYNSITFTGTDNDNLITEDQLVSLISLVDTELGISSPRQFVRGICNEVIPEKLYTPLYE
jgi:hypothetical protein